MSQLTPTDETVAASGKRAHDRELERGESLGRYIVLEHLGSGGMGVVVAGYDPELQRRVAIKLLRASPEGTDTDSSERLVREAQAMARLNHPNVVGVLDVGRRGPDVYIAMELVEGSTLDAYLEENDLGWREVVRVFAEAARGLEAAHAAGIVHRDFKPSNVMVTRAGAAKVMDLGLARASRPTVPPPEELAAPEEGDVELTRPGALLGTPAYMAPEQYLGQTADERSDQFSFCVALYEALHGERPFPGETPAALAFNVSQGKRREGPARSRAPTWLSRVLDRGLAIDPAERYPSMAELRRALESDPAVRRRNVAVLAAAGLSFALGAGGLTAVLGAPDEVCAGAGDRLAEVWNDESRGRLQRAFAGSGLPYAPRTATRVSDALDAWATDWSARRTGACEATHVHREQSVEVLDLRMACLDERLHEVDVLLDVLAGADDDTIKNATRAVHDLRPLSACDDVASLRAGIEPPADPEDRKAAAEIRQELARAKILDDAGRYPDAMELTRSLLDRAIAIEHGPTLAEVRLRLAGVLAQSGKLREGATEAEEAYFEAVHVHPAAAAEAAVMLVRLYGGVFSLSQPEKGLDWARHAEAALRSARDPAESAAALLVNRGTILANTAGRKEEGLAMLADGLAGFEAILGPNHPRIAAVLSQLGYYIGTTDPREAKPLLERAIAIREKSLGPEHPRTAGTRMNLALALEDLGELEAAEKTLSEVIQVFETSLPPQNPNLASAYFNMASLMERNGRWDEAEDLVRRAVEMRRVVLGVEHPLYTWGHAYLVDLLVEANRPAATILAAVEAYVEATGALPPGHKYQDAAKKRVEALRERTPLTPKLEAWLATKGPAPTPAPR